MFSSIGVVFVLQVDLLPSIDNSFSARAPIVKVESEPRVIVILSLSELTVQVDLEPILVKVSDLKRSVQEIVEALNDRLKVRIRAE
jgi:copper chaperone CopZ